MKDLIYKVLDKCKDLDAKLDVITVIGLACDDETFRICENIREELVETESDLLW